MSAPMEPECLACRDTGWLSRKDRGGAANVLCQECPIGRRLLAEAIHLLFSIGPLEMFPLGGAL